MTDICSAWSDSCLRTILGFDDHLLREAKELAARDGETLTLLVERAVLQAPLPVDLKGRGCSPCGEEGGE